MQVEVPAEDVKVLTLQSEHAPQSIRVPSREVLYARGHLLAQTIALANAYVLGGVRGVVFLLLSYVSF